MPLFRQQVTPAELGAIVYDSVHRAFLEGPMSYEAFAEKLGEAPEDLPREYPGEVLMALLYSATLAIEATYEETVGGPILEALVNVYIAHGVEGGLSNSQVEGLKSRFRGRVHEYDSCLRDNAGADPAWHLGKVFYKHVLGEERRSAVGVTTAAGYFFGSVDGVKGVLRQYKVAG